MEGRVPKPEPVLLQLQVLANDAGAGVLPPPVPVITNAVAINDWELTDCYAMFLIYNTCDVTTQQLLLTCRTSFEMWTRLETQFLQRAADNMHLIHLEFMNKRPQDGPDIMVHVTALETLAAQLNDLGEPISDNTLMTTILCKLPPRFKWLTHAWQNLRDNERTLEAFRTRLMSEQRSLDLENAAQRSNIHDTTAVIPPTPIASAINGDANAALFGQYGNKGNNSRNGRHQGGRNRSNADRESTNRSEAVCSYCGKSYHYRFECKQRIANENVKSDNNKRRREEDDNPPPGPSRHKSDISMVSTCYFIAPSLGDFFLDSGCSRHMSGERSYFKDLRLLPPNSWPVHGIGSTVLHALGIGTINILIDHSNTSLSHEQQIVVIHDVLFVLGLGVNLISVISLLKKDFAVSFTGKLATITSNNKIFLTASQVNDELFKLDGITVCSESTCLAVSTTAATLSVWHERLCHANRRIVRTLATSTAITGMDVIPGGANLNDSCHGCELGKFHKLPFPISTTVYTAVGECIVSDSVGPFQVESVGGARYYILFKDLFSGYKAIYFIKFKSEAGDCFNLFNTKIFTETGHHIRKFRCDGAGEFVSTAQRSRYAELGIALEFCAAYTPEQNSNAERDHRFVVEGMRSVLQGRGIPLKMWAESTNHTTYVQNRTLRYGKTKTPYELWSGKTPDVSNLRIFGSTAYFWNPDALRQKLDPKASKGAYVGQSEEQKACRIYVEATGRTHVTRHVKVFESEPFWIQPTTVSSPPPGIVLPDVNPVLEPSASVSSIKNKTQPVALPPRKSLRGLVPKKYFPMETKSLTESFHS